MGFTSFLSNFPFVITKTDSGGSHSNGLGRAHYSLANEGPLPQGWWTTPSAWHCKQKWE